MKSFKLKSVELIDKGDLWGDGPVREVICSFTNGVVVHIAACCGSWEQWGWNEDLLYKTMPIAERCSKWLNGDNACIEEDELINLFNNTNND